MSRYNNVTTDFSRWSLIKPVILDAQDQWGRVEVATATPQIELNASHGISELRDVTREEGSGTVTNTVGDGVYTLATTSGDGSDVAGLQTASFGDYLPNFDSRGGLGGVLDVEPTGNQVLKIGIFRVNETGDAAFFEFNGDGVDVVVEKGGTEKVRVSQDQWNGDRLNGVGGDHNESGLTLDITSGYVFNVQYAHYGQGPLQFIVYFNDNDGFQKKIVAHRAVVDGEASLKDPSLPVTAIVKNNGTTGNPINFEVSGRSFQVVGPDIRLQRTISEATYAGAITVQTTDDWVPIIAYQIKSNYDTVPVRPEFVQVDTDQDVWIQVRIGTDINLSSGSFGTPSDHKADETAVNSKVDDMTIGSDNGNPIGTKRIRGGSGPQSTNSEEFGGFNSDVPNSKTIVLLAKTAGGADAAVNAVFAVTNAF